jgi:hypothetical protein
MESIPKILINKLEGVKYANMYQDEQWEQQYVNNTASIDSELMVGVAMFLKGHLGFKVAIIKEQLDQFRSASASDCEFTSVSFTGEFNSDVFSKGGIVGASLTFSFCDGSTYSILILDYGASREAEHYDEFYKQRKGFQTELAMIQLSSWSLLTDITAFSIEAF